IPDLMYFLLIAGGLNAAFIPVFTSYLANDQEEEGWRLASTFFGLILALLLLMVVLWFAFAPSLSPLIAYSYCGEERAVLFRFMQLMFTEYCFAALAGVRIVVHCY